MAVKNKIGYSPLTNKVYLGKQNAEKRLWVCDVCGSDDVIEVPHMGKNCNRCHPL